MDYTGDVIMDLVELRQWHLIVTLKSCDANAKTFMLNFIKLLDKNNLTN